jgi:amidase
MSRFGRRDFLKGSVLVAAAAPSKRGLTRGFAGEEATLKSLQDEMAAGTLSSAALTAGYLARVEAHDKKGPTLRAFLELNPHAQAEALALDKERKEKGPRGPLHGIPVALKDNIDTAAPMQTTAGSFALEGVPTLGDAPLVQSLRAAGAVILGKTNLAEWANARASNSTNGWSARGGLTRNPYALDRSGSGSSTGSAVAVSANLCALAVGTETDGSILAPASVNGIVGLKPTVGLVSRTGIVPISPSQDTAGPMARTVEDVAALLTAMAAADPIDAATQSKDRPAPVNYAQGLTLDALKGARLGVVYRGPVFNPRIRKLRDAALQALRDSGAVLVDGLSLPRVNEEETLLFELKASLAAYLKERRPASPHQSLADLIAFNEKNAAREFVYFEQDFFLAAEKKGPLSDPAYKAARAKDLDAAKTKGIDALLAKDKLDALVAVTLEPASLVDLVNGDSFWSGLGGQHAAVAGYPSLTVPMGHDFGLPVGLSFFGRAWSEQQLIRYAWAYEQATKHRRMPQFLPTARLG